MIIFRNILIGVLISLIPVLVGYYFSRKSAEYNAYLDLENKAMAGDLGAYKALEALNTEKWQQKVRRREERLDFLKVLLIIISALLLFVGIPFLAYYLAKWLGLVPWLVVVLVELVVVSILLLIRKRRISQQ